MKKRAQIGLIETVMVLVVFFFLLAAGLMVYKGFADRAALNRDNEALQMRALQLAQVVSNFPELQCSSGNVVQANCIDMAKAEALAGLMASNPNAQLYYYDTFLLASITVEQIYPEPRSFTIYTSPPEGDTLPKSEVIYYPLTVYDPIAGRGSCLTLKGACNFGVVIVEAYR